jgi:hypothetical protein
VIRYQVCNRLLSAETNEHCEWDGDVSIRWADNNPASGTRVWECPGCRAVRGYDREHWLA